MIKQKLCMLLITYKQIGVHDSFPTSQMNHFILIMAQSRDTIERKDLCALVYETTRFVHINPRLICARAIPRVMREREE